jgi:hypothetical protein
MKIKVARGSRERQMEKGTGAKGKMNGMNEKSK